MPKVYLCNTFTNAMLDPEAGERSFRFAPMDIEDARDILLTNGFEQAVGHPATCEVLSKRLNLDIQAARLNVRLQPGELLIVAQVVVPRLTEGQVLSQEQVESCPLQFWFVSEE